MHALVSRETRMKKSRRRKWYIPYLIAIENYGD
jgi:hypothetical protein